MNCSQFIQNCSRLIVCYWWKWIFGEDDCLQGELFGRCNGSPTQTVNCEGFIRIKKWANYFTAKFKLQAQIWGISARFIDSRRTTWSTRSTFKSFVWYKLFQTLWSQSSTSQSLSLFAWLLLCRVWYGY